MSLSKFGLITFFLLFVAIEFTSGQYWNSWGIGQCYGRHERYAQCASTCPDTCDDIRRPNPGKICTMMCRMGCECIPPFVRSNQSPNSRCVHPSRCRSWY